MRNACRIEMGFIVYLTPCRCVIHLILMQRLSLSNSVPVMHEDKLIPVHIKKAFERRGGVEPLFITSALEEGEWSALRPGCIILSERNFSTHYRSSRSDLDVSEKK